MKKRVSTISFILFVSFIIGICSGKNESYAATKEQTKDVMTLTGITIDKKGNFIGGKKKVTRGEFAQMIAQASPYSGEVKKAGKRKFFKDVNVSDEKAVYINFAITKGYMSGYLDGKFKPNQGITLREAIYSVLNLLGYTKGDFSGNLSEARYEKYKELGLGKHIIKQQASILNQTDCMYLFYNLLNAKKKTGEVYATTIGYAVTKENQIDYLALLEKKRKGSIVVSGGWQKKLPISIGKFKIYKNGKEISLSQVKDYSIVYYVKELKKMWVYDSQVMGTVNEISSSEEGVTSVTINGKVYSTENSKKFKSLIEKKSIEVGDMAVLLLGREKRIASILSVKKTIAEQGWEKKLPISLKSFELFMNDKKVDNGLIEPYSAVYYIKELKKMWVYNKKVFGTLDGISSINNQPNELTVDGATYIVENQKEMKQNIKETKVKKGEFIILLVGKEDMVCAVLPIDSVAAVDNWKSKIPFSVDSAIITKNGKKVSANQIESYDILYYSKELKMIWDYNKKIYGVVNEIKPDKTAPEEITVAGKTYSLKGEPVSGSNLSEGNLLGENKWGNQLSEKNIQVGSDVVLLFGPKDVVVDIYSIEKMEVTMIGYVTQRETKMVKDVTGDFAVKDVIKIVDTSGMIREFVCADKAINKGNLVEIRFDTTIPTITKLERSSDINFTNETIKIADDARIIDVNEKSYTRVSKKELLDIKWNIGNILYYKNNASGEVTDMILYNTTGTAYQYGIINEMKGGKDDEFEKESVTFICNIGGVDGEYGVDEKVSWGSVIGPKAFRIENNEIKEMKDLIQIPIRFIEGKQANTGTSVYRIFDQVLVYYFTNGKYYLGNLDDIKDANSNTIYGYVEQKEAPIRVLVVSK